eukprot:TRINITY_DN5022_c0_g1_i3.p1 TRINITY_DN5022_c0_g1~~TRINITY_DN5022_c0_g1_i3.p1  ORF type:complete len:197 (+),score=55.97 TRINITY_DN5022_c0_g1_i3:344-934(+)
MKVYIMENLIKEEKNGEGVMSYTDGRIYTGTWKNDLWNGNGNLVTKYYTYTGAFVRGLFEGKGRIEYSDECVYDGYFKNNLRHGKGKLIRKTGYLIFYDGDWQDDVQEGQAELQFSSGDLYLGPVSNGAPHGTGKLILACNGGIGTTIEAKFVYGVLEGKVDVNDNFSGETYFVDEGRVMGENMDYLIPPFCPILH